MIDVLVTLAVILTLLAISMPGYTKVREHANRLVCRSGIRQIGYAMAMYADQNRDRLPPTMFITPNSGAKSLPQDTCTLRLSASEAPDVNARWDGLGILYDQGILSTAKIFYCPSYSGQDQYEHVAMTLESQPSRVTGNYQFRGVGPNNEVRLSRIEPNRSALISDSLRSKPDYSHRTGTNVLRADLSVFWYADSAGVISNSLAEDTSMAAVAKPAVEAAWINLDVFAGAKGN